jgi:hypothetical protein
LMNVYTVIEICKLSLQNVPKNKKTFDAVPQAINLIAYAEGIVLAELGEKHPQYLICLHIHIHLMDFIPLAIQSSQQAQEQLSKARIALRLSEELQGCSSCKVEELSLAVGEAALILAGAIESCCYHEFVSNCGKKDVKLAEEGIVYAKKALNIFSRLKDANDVTVLSSKNRVKSLQEWSTN